MDLENFERISINGNIKEKPSLEILPSGWLRVNSKIIKKYELDKINRASVYKNKNEIVLVFDLYGDRKLGYNSSESRGFYIKGHKDIIGKYSLIEVEENNDSKYLKFEKEG